MHAEEPIRRRRRGDELETALLDAAWDELVEVGYARMTMETVAARAHTGNAVLYRRWPNKDQLVLAALEHHRAARPIELPDTGALRTDLIEYLTTVSRALAGFFAIVMATSLAGLLADTGLSPAQVRGRIMAAQSVPPVRTIYRRAAGRGELDLDRVSPAVLAMPFDLVRHDLLMDMAPARPARIRAIVDDLFLPLVERQRTR